MKHGIYYAYWENEWEADYIYYIEKAAQLGFDVLEIGAKPLPEYTPNQIAVLRESAAAHHIALTAGYGPSPNHNMGSCDPAVRAEASEWFRRLFDTMSQLDMHLIGGALYSYWPIDFSAPVNKESDWQYSVEGICRLSELARPYHIMLCMEVLNRFENHILNTAEEGIRFVKEVGQDNVKVMLDTFHMNIEETSITAAIRATGSLLGHFHTGECNRMVPGQGRMPWHDIGEALRDIHYKGITVMEPFVRKGGQIEKDIHIWRDLKPNITEEQLDLDAQNALAFERYMFDESSPCS